MGNAAINRFEWLRAVTQAENLLPAAKVIATALSVQFADDKTGRINPKVTTLADYVKMSVDTVKRAIRALADAGWLGRTEGRGRRNHTSYTMCSRVKSSHFRPKRRGAPVHLSIIRIKQSLEQKVRATSQQPSPHLCAVVHRGSFRETDWNDWLTARNYSPLTEIGERSSDAGGTG